MNTKVEFLLNEALSLSSSERANIAHCLISSIDEPVEENVDQEWIGLAKKRLMELKSGEVKPVSWDEIKGKVRAS